MNRLRPPEVHWRLRRVRLSTARRIGVGLATFVLAVVLAAVGGLIAGYTQGLSNPDGQRWMAGIGGLAGAVLGLVGSILVARRDQRRADRRQALAARDSVLMMLPRPISLSSASSDGSNPPTAVLTTLAPSQLLLTDRQATGLLWARSRDLARLQAWVESTDGPMVGILTGPAGVGKTRLTIQLATALKASWVTGRLRASAVDAIRAVIGCSEPTLVVIEANGWRPEIAAVLDDLAELDRAHQHGVKLLLVSRHRDWLPYLRSQVRADTAALIDAASPCRWNRWVARTTWIAGTEKPSSHSRTGSVGRRPKISTDQRQEQHSATCSASPTRASSRPIRAQHYRRAPRSPPCLPRRSGGSGPSLILESLTSSASGS